MRLTNVVSGISKSVAKQVLLSS